MFFDVKRGVYTFERMGCVKRVPLRFKVLDSTRRFRIEKLRGELGL